MSRDGAIIARSYCVLAFALGAVLTAVGALLLEDPAQVVAIVIGVAIMLFAGVRALDSEGSRRREALSAKDRAGGPAHPW